MSDDGGVPSIGVARKKKIAIGVIFLLSPNKDENSKFQEFFFSHFPLFESHMNKLKSSIEQVWSVCVSCINCMWHVHNVSEDRDVRAIVMG